MTSRHWVIGLLTANLCASLYLIDTLRGLERRVERLAPPASATPSAPVAPDRGPDASGHSATKRGGVVAVDSGPVAVDPVTGDRDDRADTGDGYPEDDPDLAAIKATFADQYADAAWTGQVQFALRDAAAAAQAFNGVTEELVDCRETVCRLALAYSDPAVFDAFIAELTVALKGALSASLYFDQPDFTGGNARVDVYLVRE